MTALARSRGFTLIELLVTMTIVAVMLGLGIPSFRSFVADQRVKTASSDLMSSMMLARSEAIKRNATVNLTPNSSASWASGWSVAVGATTVQTTTIQSGDSLSIAQKDTSNTTVGPTVISFGSTGRPAAKVYFQITGMGSAVKCVKLDSIGIPTSTNGSCS
jgi:type IV fimbrial biogenesis protein FimT